MVSDRIENLKQQYTDKYVVVDAARPELARFRDIVGQVKTVNMSGRVLVEFLDYHANIGWYDVDPDYLKVVDKPAPKPQEAPKAKPQAKQAAVAKGAASAKAAGGKKLSPLEMARAQGAKKPAGEPASSGGQTAGAKKPSTADILAAARGGAAATPKAKQPAGEPASAGARGADTKKLSTADILAAARGKQGAAPPPQKSADQQQPTAAKPSAGKMSTADILAAARGGAAAGPQAEETAAPEPTPPAAEPESEAVPAAKKPSAKLDKSSMSVDEMLARCREQDKK